MTWVDDLVRPFIPFAYRPETYLPVKVPGFGLIIAFLALTVLGFLTANLVGRTFVEIGEMILERVPIVRPIYRGLKQVFETLFSKSGSIVPHGRTGRVSVTRHVVAGVSLDAARRGLSAQLPSDAEYVSAFMPCTPNPTTGFFFYVPRREVIELDIPVEDAAKLMMTAGMIQPGGNGEQHKKLAALAETARAARSVPTSTAASSQPARNCRTASRHLLSDGRHGHCFPGGGARSLTSVRLFVVILINSPSKA